MLSIIKILSSTTRFLAAWVHSYNVVKVSNYYRIVQLNFTICVAIIHFFLLAEPIMERDRFMSPEEAAEWGLIDKVLEHPPLTTPENENNEES